MKTSSPRLGDDDDSLWFGRIYIAVWILHGSYCDMGFVLIDSVETLDSCFGSGCS